MLKRGLRRKGKENENGEKEKQQKRMGAELLDAMKPEKWLKEKMTFLLPSESPDPATLVPLVENIDNVV